jgi:NTE family protein
MVADAAAPAGAAALRRFDARHALLVASLGALLAFLDATIVNVAFPAISTSFSGSSLGSLSWVLNAYNIVFAAFLVPAGRLADLLGRRRVFTTGIMVFTAASVACAASPSLGWLVAARGAQAAGAALLVPASLGLVVAAFPAERRAHAVGLWGATAAAAAGLGPPLGGALIALGGWRLAFLINLPIGIAAVAAARRVLVESRAPGRRTLPDLAGGGILTAALAALTLAIVEGGSWGWTSGRVLAAFAFAAAFAAVFVRRSRRHPVPVLDPALLKTNSFVVASALSFAAGAGFFAYLLNNILWLHYVWGWSLLVSGLAVAPAALVAAAVAGPLGKLADRRGHRLVAAGGAVVWTGAYLWYATRTGVQPSFLTDWLPGQVLSGIGVAATLPVLGSAALAAVPGGRFATASSIVTSARQLGGVIGVSLLVVLVGTPNAATIVSRVRHGWLFSAACFLAVAVGAMLLRRGRETVDESDNAVLTPNIEVAAESKLESGVGAQSLFDALAPELRSVLLGTAASLRIRAGETLFERGDPSDAAYIVAEGRLDVFADGDLIRELRADDVVGELGLLAGTPRSATVRARRDSILLRIDVEQFERALGTRSPAQRALTAALAAQLQLSRPIAPSTRSAPRIVAVVAATPDADAAFFAEVLRAALTARVRVALLFSSSRDGLDRAELENDRVLLVAGHEDEAWREFCVRQADRLILVGRGEDLPPPGAAVSEPCYLVLTGAKPSSDRLTSWHDRFGPRRSYSCSSPADFERVGDELADRLTGRSVGVALAGGGARALAAIGVLAELEVAGIRVDRLSGCSLGGLVAALYANGRDAAAVDAACYDEFVRRNPLADLALPRVALTRGRRADAALRRQLGDVLFEELPRQLALVSTDMVAHRTVTHRRGAVRHALRASLSLPVLLPPVRLDDTIHVDGGILDNLPVTALDSDEGPTLAVNISTGGSLRRDGHAPRIPGLPDTLLRSMLMGNAAAMADARADATITVTPDTRGIGLFEFHQIDRAIEAGRAAGAAAVDALSRWNDAQ